MAGGGSGAYRTIQVRFIVDPLLINRSAPPTISVTGSKGGKKENGRVLEVVEL